MPQCTPTQHNNLKSTGEKKSLIFTNLLTILSSLSFLLSSVFHLYPVPLPSIVPETLWDLLTSENTLHCIPFENFAQVFPST
jgi:hypothetical protein